MSVEVLPEAIEFLRSRVAQGAAEYGGPLVTHDGRDTPLDAVEEAGDLFLYVFKDYMERDEKEDELIRLRSDLEEARRDLEDYEDALAESECIDAERTEENARLRGQLDGAYLDYEGAMIDLERIEAERDSAMRLAEERRRALERALEREAAISDARDVLVGELSRTRAENAELREHILTQASVISEYQKRLDGLKRLDREERVRESGGKLRAAPDEKPLPKWNSGKPVKDDEPFENELSRVPDLTGGLDWTGVE